MSLGMFLFILKLNKSLLKKQSNHSSKTSVSSILKQCMTRDKVKTM